jgi:hypothetical protein
LISQKNINLVHSVTVVSLQSCCNSHPAWDSRPKQTPVPSRFQSQADSSPKQTPGPSRLQAQADSFSSALYRILFSPTVPLFLLLDYRPSLFSFQACGMFLGEFFCLIVFYLKRFCQRDREELPKFNPLIFWPAALLDMCGTSLMYVGLNMTFASSFQMLRGMFLSTQTFVSRQC